MVLWRTSLFQLILAFFGLTLEYRGNVFTQIHEILFYGQGGYDYETIYNMPLWLRRFTYNKIHEHYEKKNEKVDTVEQSIIFSLVLFIVLFSLALLCYHLYQRLDNLV